MQVTEEDRVSVDALALLLGVSGRELIEEFEQLTPEEDAELESVLNQANVILPQMRESLARMEKTVANMRKATCEMKIRLAAIGARVSRTETMIEGM